jgi:GNAT superfamily N-acetyltransferase
MADELTPATEQNVEDIPKDESTAPVDPLAGVPELKTFVATDETDMVDGLKLIADSIAQQRQTASRILISHPVNVAVFGIILAAVAQWMYKTPADLVQIFISFGGISMAALAATRYLTRHYIFAAEDLKWSWLDETDTMLLTRFGKEAIGVLVLAWEKGEKKRKKSGKGLIKAWTTKLRYRHKGVGRALLEEAVEIVNQRGGYDIDFTEDHASKFSVSLRFS